MSRELRDKADIMIKELNELLQPLREEISILRSGDTSACPHDLGVK
ncbi:MAG TPA: hypothetical protein VF857_00285 [Spirochaetota bacterium]